MNVSDYAALQRDAFRVKTGVAVAVNDLLELGPDGKAYPVKCTDYAAVANCVYGTAQTTTATGMIVAQTQVATGYATNLSSRQAFLQGLDGNLYLLTPVTGTGGLLLSMYSSVGTLISQVTLEPSQTFYNNQVFFLSNGNLCVIADLPNVGIHFAIYTSLLNVVKPLTTFTETAYGVTVSACALASGGFAAIYQQSTSNQDTRFVAYSETGTIQVAPTTVWTRTGTVGVVYNKIALLSDGGLAVAVFSTNASTGQGLFYAVLSSSGVKVKDFTNLSSAGSAVYTPELSVAGSKFAIAKAYSGFVQAFVFDNLGNLQGSGFSSSTASSQVQNSIKLINDGLDFWLLWTSSVLGKVCLTKIPNTGAGYATTVVSLATNQANHFFDAFCENGLIVAVSNANTTSTANVLWVIKQSTGLLVSAVGTPFGNSGFCSSMRLLPTGDFSFACMHENSNGNTTNFTVGKYANTAVLGCANTNAAADTLVPVSQKASGYAVNYIKGSPSKSFDHSATNIVGNKGTVMNYGAVLKGI